MALLDAQIAELRSKYDPLCRHLTEIKQDKINLTKTLARCMTDEKQVNIYECCVFFGQFVLSELQWILR